MGLSRVTAIRISVVAISLLLVFFFGRSFLDYIFWSLSKEGLAATFKGRWDLAILNIIFFLAFLAFLPFRKKVSWRSHGIFSAFVIALFMEMYGIPLTIFLFSGLIGSSGYAQEYLMTLDVFGTTFFVTDFFFYGTIMTFIGILFVIMGWRKIHKSESLVTDGIYGFSRHPQYVGILLMSLGFMIGWTTPITFIMFPVLVFVYYKLAKSEEADAEKTYGKRYRSYKQKVPMFI
jgi:protein-S-isoprenylcysteine O-methyltransferase Ste14